MTPLPQPYAVPVISNANQTSSLFQMAFNERRLKLYCRSGFYLEIHPDGTINGTRCAQSKNAVLKLISVSVGLNYIHGAYSGRFLCMNNKGKLYGSVRKSEECIFSERLQVSRYNTYASYKYSKHRQWYVALNRRGKPRRGNLMKRPRRCTHFMTHPVSAEWLQVHGMSDSELNVNANSDTDIYPDMNGVNRHREEKRKRKRKKKNKRKEQLQGQEQTRRRKGRLQGGRGGGTGAGAGTLTPLQSMSSCRDENDIGAWDSTDLEDLKRRKNDERRRRRRQRQRQRRQRGGSGNDSDSGSDSGSVS